MTPERIEELARAVAYYANECCGRSDGYEQEVAKQAAGAIRTAVREFAEDAMSAVSRAEDEVDAVLRIKKLRDEVCGGN